jgi:SAM-dependent methyltransferase
MRALPFRRHFDLALLISAFGYFDTEAQGVDVLREIARVLQPTGRLLLRNPNAISIRNNFKSIVEEERNGRTIQLHNALDERGHWMDQHVIIRGEEGVEEYQRQQRIYSTDELEEVLERAGFSSFRHFSTPEGAPFDESASPDLITVCRVAGLDV